jgi:hypothetical protein
MSDQPKPFSERDDDERVDDLLDMMADALNMNEETVPQDVVNDLVAKIFEERGDQIGILGNFIFMGEIINADGIPEFMVVTSDNLPEWVARGMIMTADDYLAVSHMGFPEE